MTERTIFLAALDQPNAVAQAAFLDVACRDDARLRARVEALLQSSADSGSFLDATVVDQARASDRGLSFLDPPRIPGSLGRLGHFEVLEEIGRGSMGVVLRARDTKLDRVVALKALLPHLAVSDLSRRQFIAEAQAAAAILNEHVIAIHAVEGDGPVPYLVMEDVAGVTLEQRLRAGGPVPLAAAVHIGAAVARGLAAAHARGLIHRDVKPGNVLLPAPRPQSTDRPAPLAKITDFGLAHVAGAADPALRGMIAGTPAYMSPEQARGEPLDPRSDLFSLGSVLYAMCVGRPPLHGADVVAILEQVRRGAMPPVRAARPDVPTWLAALINRLHAPRPQDRPASAREVAEELARHADGVATVTRAPFAASARRRRRVVAVGALAAMLLVLAALALYFRSMRVGGGPPAPLELRRDDIPAPLLTLAGGGDPAQAPPELAAVLGGGRFLLPHVGQTAWMDQSADGRLLAVPLDEDVILFDVPTGTLMRTLPGPGGRAFAVAFSPDGRRLAVTTRREMSGGAVRVWELPSGRVQFTAAQPGLTISCAVAFSPDGRHLYTEAGEQLHVRAAESGELVQTLDMPRGITAIRLAPGGHRVAVANWIGNVVKLFDRDGDRLVEADPRSPLPHPWPVTTAIFSPDGNFLAAGDLTGFTLRDAHTRAEVRRVETAAEQLAFMPDSRTLIATTTTNQARPEYRFTRWDVPEGKERPALVVTVAAEPLRAFHRLSSDGSVLFVVAQHDATYVRVIDTATGVERFPRVGHNAPVYVVAVSPDGRLAASAGADRNIVIWDLANGRVRYAQSAHAGAVFGLAFSPDGKQLASGSSDGTIALWEVATGTEVRALHRHARLPTGIAFSPDGRTIAAGGEDGRVKLWDVATGQVRSSLPGHTGLVRSVAYQPGGTLLASGGEDGTLRLHERGGGRAVEVPLPGPVRHLAFAADGQSLAAVGGRAVPFVYRRNLNTGAATTRTSPRGPLHAIAVSPAAPLLATAAEDGTVCLWDDGGDVPIRTIGPGPFGGPVRSLAFTPDGRYLATANANGTVYLLRVAASPP